ncbi:hypothetical protein N7488_004600 [Penicillium malachiteum]|nr:hypothetical protein N7488_004600 [Penicillium malachiteum]
MYLARFISPVLESLVSQHEGQEIQTMNTKAVAYDTTKFRILMLHGYGGSGSEFHAKSSPISKKIHELLLSEILDDFPGGIEFLYPNAPLALEPPIGFGDDVAENDIDPTALGWWYGRDTVSRYRGIENSLLFVANYIHGRPIHGIIGFSQGACLSGMVCSLVECNRNPEKAAAARYQNLPVDAFIDLPGQESLRFFIGIGGYRGTLEYYGSLYSWPIETPSCHALGSMDCIVKNYQTMDLAHSFTSYELVHFYGCHYVPRDRASVDALAHFALRTSLGESESHWPRFPSLANIWSQSDGDEARSAVRMADS